MTPDIYMEVSHVNAYDMTSSWITSNWLTQFERAELKNKFQMIHFSFFLYGKKKNRRDVYAAEMTEWSSDFPLCWLLAGGGTTKQSSRDPKLCSSRFVCSL
jgi:hypothetical protein